MLEDAIAVCKALAAVGIWLELHPETQMLILGPTATVQAHPHLLHQVREVKQALLDTLSQTLAYEVLATPDSGRFQLEVCPECRHNVFVVLPPRRLAVHRTPDGRTVCPGAVKAQEAVAHELMQKFVIERCVQRPGAVLTWMALRGGLEGWARDQGFLLPPRSYLLAWMDAHYKRASTDEIYASWHGVTFLVREWLGEEEESPEPAPVSPRKPKLVAR